MSETIKKSIGEGVGKGELYSALAHDTSDKFGGLEIKSICLNWATYDETTGDGRICFYDRNMYIAPWQLDCLDIVAPSEIYLFADDIYLCGNLHFYGEHDVETSTSTIAVTITDPSTATNAMYGYVDAGVAWATGGRLVGLRGKVTISASGDVGSAAGVWAGLNITSTGVQRYGVHVALNAEAYSSTINVPNAIMYLQSLPFGATTDFSDVPYLVFSETVTSGTGSNILFEVGHSWANTIPTLDSDELFYQDTLRIAVNKVAGTRTKYYIPLSTTTGTFTYAYPIITSYATTAITIGTAATGISMTGTYSTAAIAIATDMAAYNDYCIHIAAECDDVSGNSILPLYVTSNIDGVGGVGRAAEFMLAPTAKMGSWGNAVKGYLNLVGATGSIGTLSAICAEVKFPAVQQYGSVAILELEAVTNSSYLYADYTSVILFQIAGTDTSSFEDGAYFLYVGGLTSGTGDMWYNNTLKCRIIGTEWYLPFSEAQGSFTTSYPIVTTYAGNPSVQIGTATTGLLVTGVFTNGISVINAATTTTGRTGILVADSFTLTTAGVHKAISATTTYTPATAGAATPITIASKLVIDGEVNGGLGFSVLAQLDFTNNANLTTGGMICGALRAVMTDSATPTFTTGSVCGIYIDNLLTADVSGIDGINTFLYMANNSATCTLTDGIYFYGPKVTNFIMFDDANVSGCLNVTSGGGGTRYAAVKVRVHTTGGGTVTGYLSIYTD